MLTAEGGDVGQCFVTYVKAWDRYVIVFCYLDFKDWEVEQARQGGVHLATSRDGVQWTAPQRIIAAMIVAQNGRAVRPTSDVNREERDERPAPGYPLPRILSSMAHAPSPRL